MGLLTGKFHRDPDLLKSRPIGRRFTLRRKIERSRPLISAFEELANHYGATPVQVALNWLVNAHGDAVVAIPGASRPAQAQESAGAMRLALTPEELALLDRATR